MRRPGTIGRGGALALIAALLAGCARSHLSLPVDPEATFAAHREGEELVLDKTRTGLPGVLAPPRLPKPGGPSFVVHLGQESRGALWVIGRSRVLLREDSSTIAPRIGEVLSSWDDGAIRLVLHARDASVLRSDTFRRMGEGEGPATLARAAGSPRGTYRATMRDEAGADAGWMRVQIDPGQSPARVYDAALPQRIEDGLAAAAALTLDAEIAWIEDHATASPE